MRTNEDKETNRCNGTANDSCLGLANTTKPLTEPARKKPTARVRIRLGLWNQHGLAKSGPHTSALVGELCVCRGEG